jgi:hypothetical protein
MIDLLFLAIDVAQTRAAFESSLTTYAVAITKPA